MTDFFFLLLKSFFFVLFIVWIAKIVNGSHISKQLQQVIHVNQETDIKEWLSMLPYFPRPLIAVIVRHLDGVPDVLNEAIKSLVEIRATRIHGLKNTTHLVANKVVLEDPIPYFAWHTVWDEKLGCSVQNALNEWMANQKETTHKDNEGVDILFFEPDVTCKIVVRAWLCTNLMFDEVVVPDSVRDILNKPRVPEISITLKPRITQTGPAVITFANKILKSMIDAAGNPYVKENKV